MIQQALVRDWGLSIRSSCRLAGMSRSHLNQPRLIAEDALRAEIRRLAYKHTRFGYRRIHALLKGLGWANQCQTSQTDLARGRPASQKETEKEAQRLWIDPTSSRTSQST